MKKVQVITNNNQYNIVITKSFDSLQKEIEKTGNTYSKICIITDDNVGPIYGQEVQKILRNICEEVYIFTFPHGEENKNLQTISSFYEFLIENKFDRKSLAVALGGGVTGDMTGYLAASYMRGIRFIQIPTSLLSQVDSSSGGKTGVDFNGYKNIVGAFYQPDVVYINTDVLSTLPKNEFSSGMGEVIKHAIIRNRDYFDFLLSNEKEIKDLNSNQLTELIYESCVIKSRVVNEDETEQGIRAILNFGHTVGHAVERLMNFSMFHGQCVSVGIVAVMYMSNSMNYISDKELKEVINLLECYGLPIKVQGLSVDEIYGELFHDKKTSHNLLKFILTKEIGTCYIDTELSPEIIKAGIKKVIE